MRAAPLPGASLASYRALEQRVAATVPDWQVTLLPPAAPLPPVGFEGDAPDAEGLAALDTAIWGARRLHLPIGVSGRHADMVIARLEAAGVSATRLPGTGAPAALAWQAPAR